MKKVLLTTAMSLMMCIGIYAQEYEWKNPPKFTEKIIGNISMEHYGGFVSEYDGIGGVKRGDHREYLSDNDMYVSLLEKARNEYGKTHPKLALRNFSSSYNDSKEILSDKLRHYKRTYYSSAKVVIPDVTVGTNEQLPEIVYKALRKVPQGSRLAVDQILVTNDMNEETVKDQLLDLLLDKGYRVVAKEYLQKLYNEQQDQLNSGLYNPDTTVEGSKFSAVGYFINVKVTETSIRVQVVNVSTGEYEGNATVNF